MEGKPRVSERKRYKLLTLGVFTFITQDLVLFHLILVSPGETYSYAHAYYFRAAVPTCFIPMGASQQRGAITIGKAAIVQMDIIQIIAIKA